MEKEQTPRQLIAALHAAQNSTLRALISTRNVEFVRDQAMPESLVCDDWDDQEPVGSRPQAEILDLLRGGLGLSLAVAGMEYNIIWHNHQFVFEVYVDDSRDQVQAYDSLDDLLKAEGSRPCFDLKAFVAIG